MIQTRSRKNGNPDLRRQHQTPSPSSPQIEAELIKYLQPSLFTPLKYLYKQLLGDFTFRYIFFLFFVKAYTKEG